MNAALIWSNLPQLLAGAWVTLQLVALSGLLGIVIAVPTAIARVAGPAWLRWLPYSYIFFFRGTPLLVQIFLVYYGLSQFDAVRQSMLWPVLEQAYWCAIIAFSLNTGAYTAEILRGAIQGVPYGEVEAARSLGMSRSLLYRRVILPRAFRLALPAYANEIILMLKGSALASTITLLDITGAARTIIAVTYTPVEIFLAAGVLYLILSFVIIQGFRWLERRLNAHLHARLA